MLRRRVSAELFIEMTGISQQKVKSARETKGSEPRGRRDNVSPSPAVAMKTMLRDRLRGGRSSRAIKLVACLAPSVVAVAFLAHAYGLGHTVAAARSANLDLLLEGIGLGVLVQIVRAQRSRWLLIQRRPISWLHSFSAMVVGHGIGDLVPMAPGGPVLRSVLTERLAGVPAVYSGGAYMVEGTLDIIAPALLIPLVLFLLPLPSWTHWVLVGVAGQAVLLLALLIGLAVWSPSRYTSRLVSRLSPRLLTLAGQLVDGLRAVSAGGLRRCVLVCAASLLLLALTAGQLALFLQAFALSGSTGGLLLLLVVMLSAGSVPLKIPAFSTMSAAAALPVAGISGPAVGGYLLVSQFLLSSQTIMLALLVLGWWLLRRTRPFGAATVQAGQDQPAPTAEARAARRGQRPGWAGALLTRAALPRVSRVLGGTVARAWRSVLIVAKHRDALFASLWRALQHLVKEHREPERERSVGLVEAAVLEHKGSQARRLGRDVLHQIDAA